MLTELNGILDLEFSSLYLFGSYARGDQNDLSDIDILAVTEKFAKPIRHLKYNIAIYTKEQLGRMAEDGSIFILHLIHESEWLAGESIVQFLKKKFVGTNYDYYRGELRMATQLLDVHKEVFERYRNKLLQVQKFLLRSYIYSLSVDLGFNCFSIEKVLEFLNLPEYREYFIRSSNVDPNFEDYTNLNSSLSSLFEVEIRNPVVTIEALLVNNYPSKNLLHTLGVNILNPDDITLGYEKIIIHGN